MVTWGLRVHGSMSALILASLLAVAAPLPAAAQEVHAFNVSATDPASALRAFGAQADMQILASADDLKGKKFNPVSGDISTEKGLSELLAGTGLDHRYVSDRAVALVKNSSAAGVVSSNTSSSSSAAAGNASQKEGKNGSSGGFRVAQVAQGASSGSAPLESSTPQTSTEEQTSLGEVVVTGTRVHRADFNLPTPITQVGSDELNSKAAANIADTLNTLPNLNVGFTPGFATDSTSAGSGGINALNLLNLGPERTLVLLDGRRITGFNSTGIPDINTLPQQLIERVDVVTGGGSADYGSDAVAGVVNFILNKQFTGFKYDAQWGESIHSDGKNGHIALTDGTPFADGRGHFIISGEYSQQGAVPGGVSRGWDDGTKLVANPVAGASPAWILAPNVNLSTATAGGLIINSPANGTLAGTQFGPGGVPEIFQFGAPTGTANLMFGGTKNDLAALIPIQGSVDTRNVFSRLSYDLSDSAKVYTELTFAESNDTDPAVYPFELGNLSIASGNPYIPASVQAQMTSQGLSKILVGTWNQDLGPITAVNDYKTYRAVVGLDVKLSDGWSLRSYYQYGRTDGVNADENEIIKSRYAQAINAVSNPLTGQIVCSNPTNGCIPLDILGTGVATQEALNWVEGRAVRNMVEQEHDVSVEVEGTPVSTWAGPVSLAFGPEVRREEASANVDPQSLKSAYFSGNFQPVIGSYNVEEFFAETVVPLARNVPLAKSLDIDAAARATNYSTSGYVTTWKFGATWHPINDLMFRASTSRDIRAPNLSDLFAVQELTETVTDPSKGGASDTVTALTGGNPNLKPEIARNYSYGVVYTPTWMSGFRASIDYYQIDVSGFLTSLASNPQQVVNLCYQGVSQLCPLVIRDSAGDITEVRLAGVNAGHLSTEGFNLQAAYVKDLSEIHSPLGSLSVQLLGTRLNTYFLNTGLTSYEYAGEVALQNTVTTGGWYFPRWKATMPVLYQQGPVSAGLTGRYVGSGVIDNAPPAGGIAGNHIAGVVYFDASLAYKTHLGLEGYVAVDNIFNKYPPTSAPLNLSPFLNVGTAQGLYDLIGTQFRVGIRGQF